MADLPNVRLPQVSDLKAINSELGDIAGKLDNISKFGMSWSDSISKAQKQAGKFQMKMKHLVNDIKQFQDGKATKEQAKQLEAYGEEIKKATNLTKVFGRYVAGNLVNSIDKFGKRLLTIGLGALEKGLHGAQVNIKRVHELFERWQNVTGKMNMRFGSLSTNMAGNRKEAARWEGTIRGLTDSFGEGFEMAQDFTQGFERMLPAGREKEIGQIGISLARGLGMGGESAGKFMKSMEQLGSSTEETKERIGDMFAGAKTAGVSINLFAKEISEARDFMVSFGKDGSKAFITAAARVRQLGVSLKTLEQFTNMTDTFDSTVESMSKLNTVFGTTINSLDMMLEQDPAKRFETVRQALLNQGKTFENLSRQERMFIGDTFKMSQDELAGVLKTGESLDNFRDRQEKEKAKQMKTDELLKKQLRATAQTLFAFGAAFDKITKHIVGAIKPLTDMIGLTRNAEKTNMSFAQRMKQVVNTITGFIDKIARNKEFQTFLKKVGTDILSLWDKIREKLGGGDTDKWIDTFTKGLDSVYEMFKTVAKAVYDFFSNETVKSSIAWIVENIGTLIKVWAGFKVAMTGAGIASKISEAVKAVSLLRESFGIAGAGAKSGGWLSSIGGQIANIGKSAIGAAGGLGGLAKMAGGVAAAGAAGFAAGSLINEIPKMLGSDKNLGEHAADALGAGKGQRKEIEKGAAWDARYKGLKENLRNAKDTKSQEEAKTALNEFLGVNEEYKKQQQKALELAQANKKFEESANLQRKKGIEEVINKETKLRTDNEKAKFKLEVTEYFRRLAIQEGKFDKFADFETKLNDIDFDKLSSRTGMSEVKKMFGNIVSGVASAVPKMADGGIVMKPTLAVVGESGPEAVVPLTGRVSQQTSSVIESPVVGRQNRNQITNNTNAASSGGQIKLVAGDVYLDGNKVGRHMVRTLIEREP